MGNKYKNDPDGFLEDSMSTITGIKQALFDLVDQLQRSWTHAPEEYSYPKDAIQSFAIVADQMLDDILYPEWRQCVEKAGVMNKYPRLPMNSRPFPTNPATPSRIAVKCGDAVQFVEQQP